MDFHLIPMKKTRKKPKTGDVFVVQPIEGVYYYGKVIISKYRSEYEMYNEMPLIYIYDEFSTKIKMPQSLEKILIAPLILIADVYSDVSWPCGSVGICPSKRI